jgi:hypothetical protein
MKVDLIAVALALCLAAGPAIAQESTTPSGVSSMSGSRLVRPCSALGSTTDCSIDLPMRRNGRGTGTLSSPSNNLMNQPGSGLNSGVSPRSAGPLGGSGGTLSRGISGGTVGMGVDPLGIDSNALLRSMSSGSLGGRSSFSGLRAAGPLGSRSSGLGSGSGSRLR